MTRGQVKSRRPGVVFKFQTTRGHMKSNSKALLAAAGIAAFAFSPANAYEAGYAGWAQKPGATIGSSAGIPPPGIYMFNQLFTYQSNIVGPLTNAIGTHTGVQAAVDVQGFIFVPGWTFLGATYDAVIAQPFVMDSVGGPLNLNPAFPSQQAGMHNTFIAPVELSWKLGTSGFVVKTGLGMYVPDGTQQGATGLLNVGNPWWTFQPELVISYLANGWNLTAFLFDEINTRNSRTDYLTGDIFHAEFTFTKTIGKWTVGPVAYYTGQVTNDNCSSAKCLGFYPKGITCSRSAVSSSITSARRACRSGRRRKSSATRRTTRLLRLTRTFRRSREARRFSRPSATASGRLRSRQRRRCSTSKGVVDPASR